MSWFAPLFRLLRRLLKWILVVNFIFLPVNLLPCMNGTIEAFLFILRAAKEPNLFQKHYLHQVELRRMLDFYSVPGAPSIHDFAAPPFNIIEVRHPTKWWEKIGLTRFTTYEDGYEPINQLASLDNLYRTVRFHERGKPWHHFLYIADGFVFADETDLYSEWDKAFSEVLKHHYLCPAVGDAEFTWLSPEAHFLADIWHVTGPALVHFTTETPSVHFRHEELEEELASRPKVFRNVPVTVRVIEFPNTKTQAMFDTEIIAQTIMPGVFPSPYEQILSVTGSSDNWELYHPYHEFEQEVRRFHEYCEELEKKSPHAFGRLAEAEDAMAKWLQPDDAPWVTLIHAMAFYMSLVPFGLASGLLRTVWNFMESWVGSRWEDRAIDAMAELEDLTAAGVPEPEPNFMADMLGGFINSLGEEHQEVLRENEEAKVLLDKMWKIAREGPQAVEKRDSPEEGEMQPE